MHLLESDPVNELKGKVINVGASHSQYVLELGGKPFLDEKIDDIDHVEANLGSERNECKKNKKAK